MKLKIQSFRGDHNCECEEQIAEAVFNKLTGKMSDPLPQDLKTKVPDTFQELEGLWREGKLGYMAFDEKDVLVKEFKASAQELLFAPKIIGG
jgi:hypothetical protein